MVSTVKQILVNPKKNREALKESYEGMSAEGHIEKQLLMMDKLK